MEHPETMTAERIDKEPNAEVRRVMIERFGAARWMKEGGAEIVDHDEQFGTLWRKDRANDSPVLIVEVMNCTPERDGSRRHYHLRVNPECRPMPTGSQRELGKSQPLTALNAVASTWGLTGKEFKRRLDNTEAGGLRARS
jgi:hypothetical protein